MRSLPAFSLICAASSCLTLGMSDAARAQSLEPLRHETEVTADPSFPDFAKGDWYSRNQLVWDPSLRRLTRVDFKFWDPLSEDELDVVWASRDGSYSSGPITSNGQLVWRVKGAASYDMSATVARYRGGLVDGRAHGDGEFLHRSGASYRGQWKNGLMDGRGRLQSPNGDEYVGEFRAGKRHGRGLFVDRLGSVYEGGFLVDKRHGAGRVQLTSGTAYAAQWLNGIEVSGTRSGIPGFNLSPLTVQEQVDDVRISLTVDRRSLIGVPNINPLYYIAENTPEQVRIFPDDAEMLEVWRGEAPLDSHADASGEEELTFMGPTVRYGPVPLVLNVENASGQPIGIAGASLVVTKSVSELRPALEVLNNEKCEGSEFETDFGFENFGWSQLQSVRVTMNFVDVDGNAVGPAFVQSMEDITYTQWIDIADELVRRNVNIDRLRNSALQCTSPNSDACLAEQLASDVFGEIGEAMSLTGNAFHVGLAGKLDYQWATADGTLSPGTSEFATSLVVGYLPYQLECGEGASEVILRFEPFKLQLDAGGYQVALPLSDEIPAGVVSRWRFWLDALKSSTHEFRLRVQLADGRTLESRPVNLLYFKPRRSQMDMEGNPFPVENVDSDVSEETGEPAETNP